MVTRNQIVKAARSFNQVSERICFGAVTVECEVLRQNEP